MYRPQIGNGLGVGGSPGIGTLTMIPFKITVDTTKVGSAADTFILPLLSSQTYDFTVDWGDNSSDVITTWNQAETTHVYPSGGSYQISISGIFPSIYFNNGGDKLKLSSIDQWGGVKWLEMSSAFYGCSNVIGNYSGTPEISSCLTLFQMFRGCSLFNGEVDNWNTTSVTNLSFTFYEASVFNKDVSSWYFSNVTTTKGMFQSASAFNQSLDSVDISSVIDFSSMFQSSGYNQPLNSWTTTAAENMSAMFALNTTFNQALSNFNVTGVTDMNSMFNGASSFNQTLNSWTTSVLINPSAMFLNATSYNQPMSNWDMSSATRIDQMLRNTPFNQDISAWNITAITNATNFLFASTLSTTNYDLLLVGWESQTEKTSVPFHGGNSTYTLLSAADTARGVLTGTSLWTITDGGGI